MENRYSYVAGVGILDAGGSSQRTMQNITLTIADDTLAQLMAFCAKRGLSLEGFFAQAIDLALYAEAETPWVISLVMQRINKMRKGES